MSPVPARDRLSEYRARADVVRSRVILSSVVGHVVALRRAGNEWSGLCPFHSDTRAGSFMVNDSKAIYKCFACGASGDHFGFLEAQQGFSFIQALEALERDNGLGALNFSNPAVVREMEAARAARDAAAAADSERRSKRGQALWFGAVGIERSPAEYYLRGRGLWVGADEHGELGLDRWPSSLRYRPDVWCRESRDASGLDKLPAMVAGIWHLSGKMLGAHRTYLNIDGWDHSQKSGIVTKARLNDAKMTIGPTLGGYIPINKGTHSHTLRDIPEGTDIYLSEGIEDGLSVACGAPHLRIIAGVSLSKLASVQLPPQMGALVFIMQRDNDGSAAAGAVERAIASHQKQRRTVKMLWPPDGYKDWNDYLMGKTMGRADHGG